MDNKEVLIRITHNYKPSYSGLDEFKKELKNEYLLQSRPKWIPSFSEGHEFWLDVFINSPAFDFIKSVVVGGLTWDLIKLGIKKISLKPLIQSIEKLLIKNETSICFENLIFEFDDITIKIIGINNNFLSNLSRVFNSLYKEIPYLQSQGLTDISRIVLPIYKFEGNNEIKFSYGQIDDFYNETDYNWEIFSGFGCQKFIYNLKDKSILEYYEKIY